MRQAKFVPLAGSARTAPRGSRAFTKQDDEQVIDVTLRIRPKRPSAELDKLVAKLGRQLPGKRRYLTREELVAAHGASDEDVMKVERFAHDKGLTVSNIHMSSRVVHLRGSIANMRAAFKVNLRKYVSSGRTYRVREGSVAIPAVLKGIVVGVHGLDNRPVARPHFRTRAAAPGAPRALTVAEIAAAYNFPKSLDGTGQCIAIIELNGIDTEGHAIDTGYDARDLAQFFKRGNLPMPEVTPVSVDGGANLPGKPDGGDDEVVLDIEVAGAVAPGAKIAVYFAPNTSSGFINAIKAAVYDKVRKPSVISISWGGPEDAKGDFAPSYMDALNEAIRDAGAVGVTVCVSSGDDGASDMAKKWDQHLHVDFPASSPFALACGGTTLVLARGEVASEVVWNEGVSGGATGGGVSNYFARPDYQANAGVPKSPKNKKGRGVPDVAGNADQSTGYRIFLDGKFQAIGGTSAVSPLMAGLFALINQRLAKKSKSSVGFVNPLIYEASGSGAFRDIVEGNNHTHRGLAGMYTAAPGWDACSGLGVVDGGKLLRLLTE